ncbi:MAG: hypothetical protein V8T48_01480, partial [Oscillospiraceae bacterium]
VFKMQDILRSHWERVFIGSILLAVLLIQSAAGADIKKVKKLFLPKKKGGLPGSNKFDMSSNKSIHNNQFEKSILKWL